MMKKICVILMICLLLAGCGKTATTTDTTNSVASGNIVTTQEELKTALDSSTHVVLGGDIQLKSGVVLFEGVSLSGDGHQLLAPTYNEEARETRASIFLISGNIENISIIGGNRGMSTDPNHRMLGHIRLTNVVANAESALYVGHGDNEHNLDAVNCELYGQTVFSRIAKANFTDCTFGYNSAGTQGRVWAYRDAHFINCRFEGMDDAKFDFIIPEEESDRTVILENCYVGDTLLTQDNLHELLDVTNKGNNTIRVICDAA